MSSLFRFGRPIACVAFVLFLAACQGNVGSTPPVTPNSMQAPTVQSAQQAGMAGGSGLSAQAQVTYSPTLTSLAFPSAGGFALTIALSPEPQASALPTSSASMLPSPNATLSPQSDVSLAATERGRHRDRHATFSGDKNSTLIELGMTVPPNRAPAPPTPGASAIPMRSAVLRATLRSPHALAIASLDALRFTVPTDLQKSGHGFSIAVFDGAKRHHHEEMLVGSTSAQLGAKGLVGTSGDTQSVVFQADRRYEMYLYADAPPTPTPAPIPVGASPVAGGAVSPAPVFSPGGAR